MMNISGSIDCENNLKVFIENYLRKIKDRKIYNFLVRQNRLLSSLAHCSVARNRTYYFIEMTVSKHDSKMLGRPVPSNLRRTT